ncbi:2483_t:CDS:2, partial [Funneliformis mosseae]
MENKLVTFHVHLPVDIEKLGQPVVIGNGKGLGEWKYPIAKLFRPFPNNNPTYWQSKPIVISIVSPTLRLSYNYAIHVPSSIFHLEDEKILFESSEKHVKYSDSDLCKLSERIKPHISNVKPENAMKVTRWL